MIPLFKNILQKLIKIILYSKYKHFDKSSKIVNPLRIKNKKYISVGSHVLIRDGVRIEVIRDWFGESFNGSLSIGDDTTIEQRCHIVCAGKLSIGSECVISANVFISDCHHVYKDINIQVLKQSLEVRETKICDQAFIGYNAVIMPGVTIGRHSIVGANSVVTKNVDDFTVVAGNPAKAIRIFDFEHHSWINLKEGEVNE